MGPTKKGTEPSRAERKAKKRKLEDAIPDLPGDNDYDVGDDDEVKAERRSKKPKTKETSSEEAKSTKKKEKETKGKELGIELEAEEVANEKPAEKKASKKDKEKKSKSSNEVLATDVLANLMEVDNAPRMSKKERKAERKAKDAAEKATSAPAQLPTNAEQEEGGQGSAVISSEEGKKKNNNNNRNRDKKRKEKALQKAGDSGKDARFIVFIGNLPFSATTTSVTKHFASVQPKSVRHLTQKDNPSKSKGIAFVEFEGYDHMKTCLKLFHHSMFDDGISPARKINVELTAGGGGNTKDRKAKIQEKNAKLNDQRTRRIQEEEKAKWEKKKEGAVDEGSIHPSRRARVPGLS